MKRGSLVIEMRLLRGLILFTFLNLAVASTTVDENLTDPTTGRKPLTARRFAIFSAETEAAGSKESDPLKRRNGSLSRKDALSSVSLASRLFPSLPVDKPSGGGSQLSSSESESKKDESDSRIINELLYKIPDRFIVTETSGVYKFDSDTGNGEESDPFATSADLMTRRSILYRLLAEIYFFFDTMDLDGFQVSLLSSPSDLQNQSLKYHLIDNLLTRSLKTKNVDTLRVLARFMEGIDTAAVSRSVGHYEKVNFAAFEQEIKKRHDLKAISAHDPNPFDVALTDFMHNEKQRIFPLLEYFATGDFNGAKNAIESSSNEIYVTMDDFSHLLKQDCSSDRYYFLNWAIASGNFNVHETFGSQLITPLMLAAQAPTWSNDIVKAILVNAPSTTSVTDATGHRALHYALNNKSLSKKHKKALVKMLELESPTYESLNQILNKY